jgi:RNA polymerase sigma-70 factor, ECF subfamily
VRGSRDPLRDPAPLVRRVYSYVAYRIGDGADAEDVTSETFVRALRYRDSYDPSKSAPATWLLGIARNLVAEHRRPMLAVPDETEASGEDESARADVRMTLAAQVARLSDRDRELIALRYGADLTVREIAKLLDLEVHAAEVAAGRALARLRELVGDEL